MVVSVLGVTALGATCIRGEPHALDTSGRELAANETPDCSDVALTDYTGTHLRYHEAPRIHPAFALRLARFEEVVERVSTAVYGRAPDRIVHYGAFSCRRVSSGRERISEHALGNALDVGGFHFDDLPEDAPVTPGMPESLHDEFRINVEQHWFPRTDTTEARWHARFFRELMLALESRDDIFRGMIGPPADGHDDHLHLDAGPWAFERYELPPG